MLWCWMNKAECRYKIIMPYGLNFMRTMHILKERKNWKYLYQNVLRSSLIKVLLDNVNELLSISSFLDFLKYLPKRLRLSFITGKKQCIIIK